MQNPATLKKADLVRLAFGLKLGPSKSALDAYNKGTLLRMVTEALKIQK